VVTTITTVTRIYVRIKKQRRLHEDDFVLFTAVALYFALAILYIIDLPYLYRFLDYASGKAPFQPSLVETYDHMMRISFAVTALFWAVLWTVKLSLLLFFRRVLHAMPLEAVKKMWWFVLALTIVTFIGCLVSEFCSCNELKDFTTLGK